MVRVCSKSSRSYSGRPVLATRWQQRERWSVMAAEQGQESAEAVVPRATSRTIPEGLTTREGLNLAGRHDHRWSCPRSDEADRLSIWAAITVAEKECCLVRKDCKEPQYTDTNVRWCGRRGEQSPRRPDYTAPSADSPRPAFRNNNADATNNMTLSAFPPNPRNTAAVHGVT